MGFYCFLTSCLLCMHHSRIYQCCWCIYMNLFVQGKLHFFHCFLTSCLLCMHHSRISIKYRMLFLQKCLMQLLSEKIVIPIIFFPTYFGNAIVTILFPISISVMPLPQINGHFFFLKWYVHIIFTTNPKWQVVTSCYCWIKKVISVLNSNLN